MSDSNRFMVDAGAAYSMSITLPNPDEPEGPPIFERSTQGWLHGKPHERSSFRRRVLQQWMRAASDVLVPGTYTGTLSHEFDEVSDHPVSLHLYGQREAHLTMISDQSVVAITDYEEAAPK